MSSLENKMSWSGTLVAALLALVMTACVGPEEPTEQLERRFGANGAAEISGSTDPVPVEFAKSSSLEAKNEQAFSVYTASAKQPYIAEFARGSSDSTMFICQNDQECVDYCQLRGYSSGYCSNPPTGVCHCY